MVQQDSLLVEAFSETKLDILIGNFVRRVAKTFFGSGSNLRIRDVAMMIFQRDISG